MAAQVSAQLLFEHCSLFPDILDEITTEDNVLNGKPLRTGPSMVLKRVAMIEATISGSRPQSGRNLLSYKHCRERGIASGKAFPQKQDVWYNTFMLLISMHGASTP
jgi:hypothetical protein